MSPLGVILGTLVLAQGVGGAASQAPQPFPVGQDASGGTATIEGVVTRIGTGEPIPLAIVQLQPLPNPNDTAAIARLQVLGPPPAVRTDAGGRFVIEGLVPGHYRVIAYRNGFLRQEQGGSEPGASGPPVELQAGETYEASFEMTPAAVIAGRILDERGEPAPFAQVAAMQPRVGPDGRQTLRNVVSTTTDDHGEYRLFWLRPGQYVISASVAINASMPERVFSLWTGGTALSRDANVEPRTESMAAFYPGVPTQALAAFVGVGAGEERAGVDIRLAVRTTFTISGRVVSPDPLAQSTLVSTSSAVSGATPLSNSYHASEVDAEGNFMLSNLEPGAYILRTRARGIGGREYSAYAPVEVTNRDVENVTLALRPGADIAVNVFVEEASTPAASEAVAGLDWSQVSVRLRSDDVLVSPNGQPTDAQGGFLFENVEPSEYMVGVGVPDDTLYLKRILVGSEEIAPEDPITVEPGFSGPLYVLLSPNGGRIEGVASTPSGERVANAAVTLRRIDAPESTASGAAAFQGLSRTDRNGNFTMISIPPGEYRLFAWEASERVTYRDPEFVRRFAARGERVIIREGDALNVNLQAITELDIR